MRQSLDARPVGIIPLPVLLPLCVLPSSKHGLRLLKQSWLLPNEMKIQRPGSYFSKSFTTQGETDGSVRTCLQGSLAGRHQKLGEKQHGLDPDLDFQPPEQISVL